MATLSLLSISTAPLGLPFEAAYVLLITVDAVCSVLRTLVTVIAGAAAVSLICERQSAEKLEAAETSDALKPAQNPVAPSPA